METQTIVGMLVVVIAIVAFAVAMYLNEAFRTTVFAYAKKKWRENKTWIYAAIDEKIVDIGKELDVEISKKTDKYIRLEVLRHSISNDVNGKAEHSAEWAAREYKMILEELLNDNE